MCIRDREDTVRNLEDLESLEGAEHKEDTVRNLGAAERLEGLEHVEAAEAGACQVLVVELELLSVEAEAELRIDS